ncbi:pyridoxamine 5'-phosphate oxidase-domain-containing protein [Rhexocercosporidium sp. MPI-PUGE-AT-0058]|nr:pyridoxamine 5'-phosphate oxidase-domain-containing protein [Rhexocercosporidium sp. MPI-PUGE-AT-0058]
MHLPLFALTVLPLAAANALTPQHIFSNPSPPSGSTNKIPTSYESAVLARRVLHLTGIGTLATVFPSSKSHSQEDEDEGTKEQRPQNLGGIPIGLMDYIADCEPTGNPTILAISIATSFKNVAAGSNISLSLRWTPPHTSSYSAASLPRFSLLGHLEPIAPSLVDTLKLAKCFTDMHGDAKYWLPGNPIHTSEWVRLVVEEVYWIGGFGDRNYIGWIPVEEWRGVEKEEWEAVRLPGERDEEVMGWMEWVGGLVGWGEL